MISFFNYRSYLLVIFSVLDIDMEVYIVQVVPLTSVSFKILFGYEIFDVFDSLDGL